MSAVEARFYVSEITRRSYDPSAIEVTLQAVSRGEHNKSWARATPNGKITAVIKNEGAAAWFADKLGQEIAVTFAPAPVD